MTKLGINFLHECKELSRSCPDDFGIFKIDHVQLVIKFLEDRPVVLEEFENFLEKEKSKKEQ
jgi:hypothetical protein